LSCHASANSNSDIWGTGDKGGNITHSVVPYWFRRPGYVTAMAKLVLHTLNDYTEKELKEGVDVLFSAHGVPQSYVAAGDLYQQHIEESVLLLSDQVAASLRSDQLPSCQASGADPAALASLARLRDALEDGRLRFHLSYQSRVGPVEWLRPYTDDKIREFGKAGVKNLAVVPVAFVSEHIETLEEIDGEYRYSTVQYSILYYITPCTQTQTQTQ
jgi:ferrochelatase